MGITAEQFRSDQEIMRRRWYEEGLFSSATITEQLADIAKSAPGRGYVFASESEQVTMSFADVLERSKRVAAGLQAQGIRPGDRVAVQVSNRPELVLAYFGAWLAGAVVVPVTHIYGPKEVSFILRQSGARMLIVPDRWRAIDFHDRVQRLDDVPALESVVMLGDDLLPGSIPWTSVAACSDEPNPVRVGADDVCCLLYTSGTTSYPKGVQHTHNSLLAEMRTMAPMLGTGRGEAKLVPWPAGHVAGLIGVCGGLFEGFTSVLMDRWDPVAAVELIEKYRCTVTSGTPLHVLALVDAAREAGRDISALKYVQVGGANVAPELIERAEREGIAVGRCYGSTEHPTSGSSSPQADFETRAYTDGHVRLGHEMQIVDEAGNVLPVGTPGEIVVRGPMQFVGYTELELNLEAFLPGGWFRTGDIGVLDERHRVTVTDRVKDIIIRGGENIASKEVEDALARHPRVREAAVVAIPDETYGEGVAAFVIPAGDESLTVEDAKVLFAELGLAPQKAPTHVETVPELPRTASGKVQKFALRDRLRRTNQAESQEGIR